MRKRLNKLRNKFTRDRHLKEIATQSAYSFGMRVLAMFVNYVFLFLVSRAYGASGWGIFAICLSMLYITTMIGTIGINIGLVKLIPQGYTKLWALYKGIMKFIIPFNLGIALIIFLCSGVIGDHFRVTDGISIEKYLKIAALGILPFSVSMINSSIFRGNKQIVKFSFYDSLGRFTWGGLGAFIFHFFSPDVTGIVAGFVAGLYALAFISFRGVRKILDKNDTVPDIETDKKEGLVISFRELFKLSVPLFWANFIFQGTLWSTTIILGFYVPKAEVGIFDATNRFAGLITIILYSINSISGPKFAESIGNKEELNKSVQASSKIIFFTTIPLFVAMFLSAPFIPSLLGYTTSGSANAQVYVVFYIILIGQLVNNLSGSVGILMQMTGYHALNRNISIVSFTSSIILLMIFTPIYGLIGASLIYGLNIAFKNIVSAVFIYIKMGIVTIYFPRRKKKRLVG